MSEIALRNVCKQFDSEHYGIKDFNLDIHDKEFVIFVGPSGCGKSTTLRIIAGLEEITDGELWIDGELSNYLEPKERGMSMVFQNYALYPNMTVYGNMAYALKIRKMPKDEIDKKVHEVAKILEIEQLLDRKPAALSGGQKQRVAIARALANDPKVLLCDEATSALDPQTTKSILHLLKQVNEKLGITIVIITHEMAVVKDICDRVAIMELGRVVEEGATEDVFVHPKEKVTKDFISTAGNVDKIYELIDEGNDLTKLQEGEKMVMLTYSANNAGEPVISYLAEAFDVKANIIYGNIDILKGKTIGKLVVTLKRKAGKYGKSIGIYRRKKSRTGGH